MFDRLGFVYTMLLGVSLTLTWVTTGFWLIRGVMHADPAAAIVGAIGFAIGLWSFRCVYRGLRYQDW